MKKTAFLFFIGLTLLQFGIINQQWHQIQTLQESLYNCEEDREIFNAEVEFMADSLDQLHDIIRGYEEYWELADSISQKESGGNYEVANDFGYLGKYQFSPETLQMLDIDTTDFLNSPLKQELAMRRYYLWCKKYFIDKLGHKTYENNRWRLHMAAHLAGPAGAIRYLQEGYNPSDAYGTTVGEFASL